MTTAPDLHARTVPLEYGPDALQFDGSPTVLFDRPGLTLVGWGTAALVRTAEASAVLAAIPCDDAVSRPGSGVVALGALPFDRMLEGHLIIPRFTMGIGREADGETHRWATAIGPTDQPLPTTDELFDSVIWQYGTSPDGSELADVHIERVRDAATDRRPRRHGPTSGRHHAGARSGVAKSRPVPHRHGPSRRTASPLLGVAAASVPRTKLHDLLPPGPRGHLLRRLARTPDCPIRAAHQLPPLGRHDSRAVTRPGPMLTPRDDWRRHQKIRLSIDTWSTGSPRHCGLSVTP